MKIGFDITVLYVAQAGVFYYHYNLLRALLGLDTPQHQYVLLDYHPIHGGWNQPNGLEALTAANADLRRVQGLRHRQLSRLWFLQKPGLYSLAKAVDQLLLWPWAAAAAADMKRRLRRQLAGLDVFQSSDVLAYAVPGARNVVTIYDLTTLLFPELHTAQTRETLQRKFRFAQEKADAIITISESARRDAVDHLGLDPAKVHVVYGGVDPAFRPLPEAAVRDSLSRWGLEPQQYILHVGTIEPRKNLVRLVEAYHQLWRELRPPAPKLVLAGAVGWLHRDLFARIRELELQDDVRLLGRVDDALLPALYNGARLFVYPSLYEGFGLPPLEAMACGVPVITSNTSSLPEVVGEAGVVVNPHDTQALAAAIGELLTRPDECERLGAAGRERAALFSWERAARETLAIYQQET